MHVNRISLLTGSRVRRTAFKKVPGERKYCQLHLGRVFVRKPRTNSTRETQSRVLRTALICVTGIIDLVLVVMYAVQFGVETIVKKIP